MTKTYSQLPQRIALALLLSGAGFGFASAAPESQVYNTHEIHHYGANGGASTVTVGVPHHYSFRNGQWVWIPTYQAEAPLPKDTYSAAYWIPRSNSTAGHWGPVDRKVSRP
jgi:hypothetical protein